LRKIIKEGWGCNCGGWTCESEKRIC
jgi:hypothetical protein